MGNARRRGSSGKHQAAKGRSRYRRLFWTTILPGLLFLGALASSDLMPAHAELAWVLFGVSVVIAFVVREVGKAADLDSADPDDDFLEDDDEQRAAPRRRKQRAREPMVKLKLAGPSHRKQALDTLWKSVGRWLGAWLLFVIVGTNVAINYFPAYSEDLETIGWLLIYLGLIAGGIVTRGVSAEDPDAPDDT